jgi:microcystin-dependent protein
MASPFLGEIRIVGFTFAPRGWAMCNGQLLTISQNTALFSLLGTTYGGNGQTTFALPDMRGNVPIHQGQGVGTSSYSLGQMSGQEIHTLTTSELPLHNHTVNTSDSPRDNNYPGGAYLGQGENIYTAPGGPNAGPMAPNSINLAGGGVPHNNMQPYLVLNFVIAMQGIFPARN